MTQKTKNLLRLILLFLISRLIIYALGIHFNTTPLTWYFQYLDPIDLRLHLFQSLFYLHSQPPGFNLFLGLVLNVVPGYEVMIFHITYITMGLIVTLILFMVLTKFNISPSVAFSICLFFAVSPPVILYENWLFYTYPVFFLLLLSAFFLYKFIENSRMSYVFFFFVSCALIVLTRTLFQAIWFLFIFIGLLFFNRRNAKKIFLAALVPFVFIAFFYIKNYVIFKEASLSSWLGMNLIKMTFTIPQSTLQSAVERGEVSEIALIKPFRDPEVYREYANFDTITGIPALDKEYKSTGAINFNHVSYISISRMYYTAAIFLIKKFPWYYGFSIIKAFYTYLQPCSSFQESPNTEKLKVWTHIYEYYVLGNILEKIWTTTYTNRFNQQRKIHVNFLFIFIPIIYAWGIVLAIRGKKLFGFTESQALLIKYMMFNILYTMFIGNFIEAGENMRFRFLIVPFIYILIALFIKHIISRKT
ncbi:hypothetical protein AMJ52_02650 [candidate division TA06 bacterium DG_78]|uniref:Glycosyltransferase RgtA/B/C/D-like domain-containing protein n=1 Tax=candidate division TA06 bacterium DG_78 TaxID=1703772 RepID=A0A0S7YHG7_UNCT6|nr:MAG: hypothetical protein AMJ52_02650 [candidate division TA06 bacterium DG_78]